MAFMTDILRPEAGLIDRIAATLKTLRANRQERLVKERIYRETLNELNALSDRDLADIGVYRGNIQSIAYAAAYDK